MCVLAFAWNAHPRWQLVMAGNRDELHARPADPLSQWPGSGVIAGRDTQAGGTWAGVSTGGRFAVVTNLRGYGTAAPDRLSRGDLVVDMLTAAEDPGSFAAARFGLYNPFNLIVADRSQAWFLSNRPTVRRERLQPAIFGLANGDLDEAWPRTVQLRRAMQRWIDDGATNPALLIPALRNEHLDADAAAAGPDPGPGPGDPEHTPIFIRNPLYGTRCSTVVAIDCDGNGTIVERRYDPLGRETGDTAIDFRW